MPCRRGVTRTGLILAAVVLIVFAVVVLVFAVRSPSRATGSMTLPTSTGPAPDIKQLPSGAQTGIGGLKGGGNFFAPVLFGELLTGLFTSQSGPSCLVAKS